MSKKISELSAGTTLTGTEEVPLVQSGSTVKTTPNEISALKTIQSGTVQATTSGTSKDFTGIPSNVKRIILMFDSVSTNGTNYHIVQIGDSGGVETSGYASAVTTNGADRSETSGFLTCYRGDVANSVSGVMILSLLDPATNTWSCSVSTSGAGGSSGGASSGGGVKSLSGTLDRVRLTTVGGADSFDAGKCNIHWET